MWEHLLLLGKRHNFKDYRQNIDSATALRQCQKLREYPPYGLPMAAHLPTACNSLQVPGCSLLSCTLRLFPPPNSPSMSLSGNGRLVNQLKGYRLCGTLGTLPMKLKQSSLHPPPLCVLPYPSPRTYRIIL